MNPTTIVSQSLNRVIRNNTTRTTIQRATFATGGNRGVEQHARIELKMGVGLRYSTPRGWDGASRVLILLRY